MSIVLAGGDLTIIMIATVIAITQVEDTERVELMTNEMIEQVAEAIDRAYEDNKDYTKMREEQAIAAIKAMREPTEEMQKAWASRGWFGTWQATIDAALKDD